MAAPAQVIVGAFLVAVGVVGVKYSTRLEAQAETLPETRKALGTKAVAALVGVFGGVTLASPLLA